jgi:hypothetical protein
MAINIKITIMMTITAIIITIKNPNILKLHTKSQIIMEATTTRDIPTNILITINLNPIID